MKTSIYIALLIITLIFLGCAQINRDNLRYSAMKRGYEVYKVTEKDSLTTAKEHNEAAIILYKEYLKAYKDYLKPFQYNEREKKENSESSEQSEKNKSDDAKHGVDKFITHPEILPSQPVNPENGQKAPFAPPAINNPFASQIEYIWPKVILEKGANEELIRALSSTASVSQMRDLLTEPSFPPLLPVERYVELGCLPPPDSAVFESTANILATLKDLKVGGQVIDPTISVDFASHVVKLFEETERTLFLQYALFRLCEMSINSPAEFRNVYPVIIHDIVRRTAEMAQIANVKAEERRIEEEKTKQKRLELELKQTKPNKETIYHSCIKAKLDAGLSDNEKIISECKRLANSKLE